MNHKMQFPLLNRISGKITPFLRSPLCPVCLLLFLFLLYLPWLFSGYYLDDYRQLSGYRPHELERVQMPADIFYNGPAELYSFSSSNPGEFGILKQKGIFPWWAAEGTVVNFWRPLTSLSLALDYTLWPGLPFLAHIHSFFWFSLLIILAHIFFKKIFRSPALAGLAVIFFAIDEALASPAGWLANRHAIVCMVFGVLCLIFYHESVKQKQSRFLIPACLAFLASLFSSEMGIGTLAYLLGYIIFMEKNSIKLKILKISAFLLIIAGWRVIYNLTGHGVTGNLLYIDPVSSPVRFLGALLTRFPVLLNSALTLPLADLYLLFSPQAHIILAPLCFILAVCMIVMAAKAFRINKTLLFWISSVLFSLVPCCTALPRNSILGFACLGLTGVVAMFFRNISVLKGKTKKSARDLFLKIAVIITLFNFVFLPPLFSLVTSSRQKMTKQLGKQYTAFRESGEKDVLLINPPDIALIDASLVTRIVEGESVPSTLQYLSPPWDVVTVERLDAGIIRVTSQNGFNPPPDAIRGDGNVSHFHPGIIMAWTNSFYINPGNPYAEGDQVKLEYVTITILKVNNRGTISQALFEFSYTLSSPDCLVLTWDNNMNGYVEAALPEIGQAVVYKPSE